MNARKLGIALVIGWMILPIAAFAAAVISLGYDEQEIVGIAVSMLIFLPHIVGTTIYTLIAINRCVALPRERIVPRLLLFLSPT
jgi:hypothetical protein